MKNLCVLQHCESDHLGLMEDHFEGRNIRFRYCRPFTAGGTVPATADDYDSLVILGAGPLGIVSGNLVPSLGPELRLARNFLARGLPVIGIGIGCCILAAASGGGAEEAPLRFVVDEVKRVVPGALGGHLPESFPMAVYMRDRPVLSADARILAVDSAGQPALFQIGGNCLGFLGHPGIKSAMVEDLIMEFDETPVTTAEPLAELRAAQGGIANALGPLMVGLVELTRLM